MSAPRSRRCRSRWSEAQEWRIPASLTSVGLVGPHGRVATRPGGPRSPARQRQNEGWRSGPGLAYMNPVGGNRVNWWRNQGQPGATFKVAGNPHCTQQVLQWWSDRIGMIVETDVEMGSAHSSAR